MAPPSGCLHPCRETSRTPPRRICASEALPFLSICNPIHPLDLVLPPLQGKEPLRLTFERPPPYPMLGRFPKPTLKPCHFITVRIYTELQINRRYSLVRDQNAQPEHLHAISASFPNDQRVEPIQTLVFPLGVQLRQHLGNKELQRGQHLKACLGFGDVPAVH